MSINSTDAAIPVAGLRVDIGDMSAMTASVAFALISALLSGLGLLLLSRRVSNVTTSAGDLAVASSGATSHGLERAAGPLGGAALYVMGIVAGVASSCRAEKRMVSSLRSIIMCSPTIFCWIVHLRNEAQPPCLYTFGSVLSWFGTVLVAWSVPRPQEGLNAGLSRPTAVRAGGHQGPFCCYLMAWLAGLVACGVRVHAEGRGGEARVRRLVLPIVCGMAAPMAHVMLVAGASRLIDDDPLDASGWAEKLLGAGALLFGAALVLLLLACTWECLQRLRLPLLCFVPLTFGYATLLHVFQLHIVYHDVAWHSTDNALLGLGSPNAGSLAIGCCMIALSVIMLLRASMADTDESNYRQLPSRPSAYGHVQPAAVVPEDLQAQAPAPSHSEKLAHTTTAKMLGESSALRQVAWKLVLWVMLLCCAVCYYFGLTRALFLVEPPNLGKKTTPVARSNLQLISFLYSKQMPVAALTVLIFSVLIPCFKFVTTVVVMHRPPFVTAAMHSQLCTLLNAMSPYQMCDIFLVMLMLAYLNIGMAAGTGGGSGPGSGYSCELRGGFMSFFVYCVVSVILAQVLELEHAPELHDSSRNKAMQDESSSPSKREPRDVDPIDVDLAPASPHADNLALRKCLTRLLLLFGAWALCMLVLVFGQVPPMSLQARAAGVIVFKQEPGLTQLLYSLLAQSMLFTSLALALVVLAPLAHTGLVLLRTIVQLSLSERTSKGADPATQAFLLRLWVWEQVAKPWVMGDVAAVALTSLYLSIQEPFSKKIFLCVRIPEMPVGFFTFVGSGVASWGLRWCTPPLNVYDMVCPSSPAEAGALLGPPVRNNSKEGLLGPPVRNHSKEGLLGPPVRKYSKEEVAVGVAPGELEEGDRPAPGGLPEDVRKLQYGMPPLPELPLRGWLPWREFVFWLFWGLVLYQFGPHAPPAVHSLEDLNQLLRGEVSTVNELLATKVPASVGQCDVLTEHQRLENVSEPGRGCKSVAIPSFTVPGVNLQCKVLWVDGIHTLQIQEIVAMPEAFKGVAEQPGIVGPAHEQRWGVQVSGQFDRLRVWMVAVRNGQYYINGFVCCPRSFHWMMRLSVVCSDRNAFYGNASVDSFDLDPWHFHQTRFQPIANSRGQQGLDEEMFGIELGDTPELVKKAIMKQIENLLIKKTGGAPMENGSQPQFVLTKLINSVVSFNDGRRCPKYVPKGNGTRATVHY